MSQTRRIPFTVADYQHLVVEQKTGRVVRLDQNGRFEEAVLYTVEGKDPVYPIVGAYFDPGSDSWIYSHWGPDGIDDETEGVRELYIEYGPKSLGWVNVYANIHGKPAQAHWYASKEDSNDNLGSYFGPTIGRVEVFEGEGLP